MPVNGLLTQVQFVARGSELTAGAAIGATVLQVESTVDFDDAGGDLELNGVRYGYSEADPDALTVTLETPLTVAGEVDDFVASIAGGEPEVDAVAYVSVGDGDDIEADIPLSLRPMLPEGTYDDVPIVLSDDLEAVVNLPGRVAVIEGTVIQTGSTGARVVITETDLDRAGYIQLYAGLDGEYPALIAGIADDIGVPHLELSSPVVSPEQESRIMLSSSGAGAPSEINMATARVDATGDIRAFGSVTGLTSVHGADIYADGQAGTGTVGASLTSQGRLVRTPSTGRVKRNVEPLSLKTARLVLGLKPVTFRYRPEVEDEGPTYPGFIAEQAAEVGADLWVTRDRDGDPAGIRYAELTAALVAIVADQEERIQRLENAAQSGKKE